MKEIEALTELMESPNPIMYSAEQYPLRHVFQSVWQRIKKVSWRYILLPQPTLSHERIEMLTLAD